MTAQPDSLIAALVENAKTRIAKVIALEEAGTCSRTALEVARSDRDRALIALGRSALAQHPQPSPSDEETREAVGRWLWDFYCNAQNAPDPPAWEEIGMTQGTMRLEADKLLAHLQSRPTQQRENTVGAAEIQVGQFIYQRLEALMDAKAGTPEGAELSYLAELIEDVEEYGAQGDQESDLSRHFRPAQHRQEGSPPTAHQPQDKPV